MSYATESILRRFEALHGKAPAEEQDGGVEAAREPEGNGHGVAVGRMAQYGVERSNYGVDDTRENGWYLRSDSYMASGYDYQRIEHRNASRAIERHKNLVFEEYMGGRLICSRIYRAVMTETRECAGECRHATPDPVKELLKELVDAIETAICFDESADSVYDEYAAKLREALGVGE